MGHSDFLPDLANDDLKPVDGVHIGESPAPGFTLRRILRGHTGPIGRIVWSPDGQLLASPSFDRTIRIWDVNRGICKTVLTGHTEEVYSISWSPDGSKLASCSKDGTIRIWDIVKGEGSTFFNGQEEIDVVAWSPKGNILASGSNNKTISLWDVDSGTLLSSSDAHEDIIYQLTWSPDGEIVASSSHDKRIKFWNSKNLEKTLDFIGHADWIGALVWSQDGNKIASGAGSSDNQVILRDAHTAKPIFSFEGHTGAISALSFSPVFPLLASKSYDNTVRIWQTDIGESICELTESNHFHIKKENESENISAGVAFHPSLNILATLGENDSVIRIWEIDRNLLFENFETDSVRYTTAKLVLVGDSGVGKTGLGWRLAHNEFKVHDATHGQQFWVIDELGATRKDGTQCEAILWDLAGQSIYRHGHPLFLDKVDLALMVFDPTKGLESLKGVEFWINQLSGKDKLPPSVLIGGRVDVGDPMLSNDELNQFCQKFGISGHYIGTSAKKEIGIGKLIHTLKRQIPWDKLETTVTSLTFKRIKEFVLRLKEEPTHTNVLVNPEDLSELLKAEDTRWEFSEEEMMTAVQHLETHGYVTILHSSSGSQTILLAPDLLVNLVSSMILEANRHPKNLGSLSETKLLKGEYEFEELESLSKEEKEILCDAAILRFLDSNICFRESLGNDNLLIFPGLIQQKRPLFDEVETYEDISYIVRGAVENVYAALVVLLGYTQLFTRVRQWQNQTQYEMAVGEIFGFRRIEERVGEIELILYYAKTIPQYAKELFQGLFEKFLYQRDVIVQRFPPVYCKNHHLQERISVIKRLREQKYFLYCQECAEKIELPKQEEPIRLGSRDAHTIRQEEALVNLRKSYEINLSKIKSYRRDRQPPRTYISHSKDGEDWIEQLKDDLKEAGVYLVSDTNQTKAEDFILLAHTSTYQEAWENDLETIALDKKEVLNRLKKAKISHTTIIPLLREASSNSAQLEGLEGIHYGDFRDETKYIVTLFDLILTLYQINLNNPSFEKLKTSLYDQWERDLGQRSNEKVAKQKPLRIFISYAREDELYRDELITMLDVLRQQEKIEIWHDGLIEPGAEWLPAIVNAIHECDVAILLLSSDLIGSHFMHEQELPQLLMRRQHEGMQIVPIILRSCLWNTIPVLKNLHPFPHDGKSIIQFQEDTGERDQIWTEIADYIGSIAEKLMFSST